MPPNLRTTTGLRELEPRDGMALKITQKTIRIADLLTTS